MIREELFALADSTDTPVKTLLELYENEDKKIRMAAAWTLRKLAISEDTTVEALREIVTCKRHYIRVLVTMNSNTPIELLNELLQDETVEVRARAKIEIANREHKRAKQERTNNTRTKLEELRKRSGQV